MFKGLNRVWWQAGYCVKKLHYHYLKSFFLRFRRYISLHTATPKHLRVSARCLQTDTGKEGSNTQSAITNVSDDTQREVQHHSKLASDWWDRDGPMKALHALNALR